MENVSRQTDHEVVVFLSAYNIASRSCGCFFLHFCGMTSGLELCFGHSDMKPCPSPLPPARPGWNGKNKLVILLSCLLVQHKIVLNVLNKMFKSSHSSGLLMFSFSSWWEDTNMVEAPHVLNVILPENQTHLLHQVGYILAIFLLLLLMLIGIIITTRHCRKKSRITWMIGELKHFNI